MFFINLLFYFNAATYSYENHALVEKNVSGYEMLNKHDNVEVYRNVYFANLPKEHSKVITLLKESAIVSKEIRKTHPKKI